MTLPGIVSEQSITQNGAWLAVPDPGRSPPASASIPARRRRWFELGGRIRDWTTLGHFRHPTAVMAGLDPATQQTAPRMSAVLSRPFCVPLPLWSWSGAMGGRVKPGHDAGGVCD